MLKSTTTKNSKYTNVNGKKFLGITFFLLVGYFLYSRRYVPTSYAAESLWNVRSVDTMKTSRDLAREKLNDPSFDETILKEVELVKGLGANYIAIDTPYDDEFLPYLRKWVAAARSSGLKIWFRGSFSNYEGWFGYSKNMTPDNLIQRTKKFIKDHPDLFKDDDIFDPCPECENAGFWKQPEKDNLYNQFMKDKQDALKGTFESIHKKVIYNWNSVIGGRAKDVLNEDTFNYLGRVVALDHYVSNSSNYADYVNYFSDFKTKVVFSEFGAPIPDIHGKMNEDQQAVFVRKILTELYKNKENVAGLNYWVLSGGTTSLYNTNYSPRKVVEVIKDFYNPAVIKGNITNTLASPVSNVKISITDNTNTVYSDINGNYQLVLPPGEYSFTIETENYKTIEKKIAVTRNEHQIIDVSLEPILNNFFYDFRFQIRKNFIRLFGR